VNNIKDIINNLNDSLKNQHIAFMDGVGDIYAVSEETIKNIITLLKEPEAVEPVTQSSIYDPDTWFFVCGSCKKGVIDRGDKFCRWCGQAVKWE